MYYSTANEMERLDELAVENGLEIRQMMELASWHMIEVFVKLEISKDKKIVIVCGKGNKGGDGLSAARHLMNHRHEKVSVVLASSELKNDSKHHLALLQNMNIENFVYAKNKKRASELINSSDVLIDSLIGYHLQGAPRGDFAELIKLMNQSGKKIISYDLPSGLDATTGECLGDCVKADATLTLALPKKVFQTENGKNHSGKIYLGDIGIPEILYNKVSPKSRPDFVLTGLIAL